MRKLPQIEYTRASTKGQIVIPQDVRERMKIREGSTFAVIQPKNDTIVLKKVSSKMSKEDLYLLKKVDEAWEDFEKGRYKKYSAEEFSKHMKSW